MAKVRVSQTWLEVTTQDEGALYVTQALVEALGTIGGKIRVSQAAVEVLGQTGGSLRVTQAVVEVLGVVEGPNPPTVTASNIDETSADLTGTAFEQGLGSSAVHESSRWIVRNAHTLAIVYDTGELEVGLDLLTHSILAGGLPGGTDLSPGAMYKNADDQWSIFPGAGTQFTTSVTSTEAAVGLQFWEGNDSGPTTLISTYVSIGTLDTDYGDWVIDENIPVPENTRYIVPCVYKAGSELTDVRVKQLQIDRGIMSSGYHPRAYRPQLDNESVIVPAGEDMGDQSGAFTVDWSEGNVALVTLGAGADMSWSNLQPFGRYWLALEQDTIGGRTVTWPTEAKFAGGTPPTLTTTAGAVDVFELIVMDTVATVHVNTLALDSK